MITLSNNIVFISTLFRFFSTNSVLYFCRFRPCFPFTFYLLLLAFFLDFFLACFLPFFLAFSGFLPYFFLAFILFPFCSLYNLSSSILSSFLLAFYFLAFFFSSFFAFFPACFSFHSCLFPSFFLCPSYAFSQFFKTFSCYWLSRD